MSRRRAVTGEPPVASDTHADVVTSAPAPASPPVIDERLARLRRERDVRLRRLDEMEAAGGPPPGHVKKRREELRAIFASRESCRKHGGPCPIPLACDGPR